MRKNWHNQIATFHISMNRKTIARSDTEQNENANKPKESGKK